MAARPTLDPPPVDQPDGQADERGCRVQRYGVAHVAIGANERRLEENVDQHLHEVRQRDRQHGQTGESQEVGVRSTDGGHTSLLQGLALTSR
ncbi:MAG: hypothetical protein E6I52_12120 [Chloroflexi bacterium]|nr:MAG: hypothetical protein E6I52_12120 [Chloroflexota bacterium]